MTLSSTVIAVGPISPNGDSYATLGSPAILSCKTERPIPLMEWVDPTTFQVLAKGMYVDNLDLVFESVTEDDYGVYACYGYSVDSLSISVSTLTPAPITEPPLNNGRPAGSTPGAPTTPDPKRTSPPLNNGRG